MLAFSTTDRKSFEAIEDWKQKIEDEVGNDIPLVLVQNKIDLLDDAEISKLVFKNYISISNRNFTI